MEINEAIESRKSIRKYLKKPVSKDVLTKIINTSLRSPSATNLQPWNLYAISGEILENIRRDNVNRFLSGGKPTYEEPLLNDLFRSRRSELAKDLFKNLI
jgi:nitroreductase